MNQVTWFCFGGRGAVRYFLLRYGRDNLAGEQWDGFLWPEPRTIILWCLYTHYNRSLRHKQNVSSSHIMQFSLNSRIQERTKKESECRLYIERSVWPWRYRGRQGKPTWEPQAPKNSWHYSPTHSIHIWLPLSCFCISNKITRSSSLISAGGPRVV